MKYLLSRYGGIGDTIILTVVSKAIKEKDPKNIVHMAVLPNHVDLLKHIPSIDRVFPIIRRVPGHIDSIKTWYGWASLATMASQYDMPIDFRYSIEHNTHYRHLVPLVGEWIVSQNSNYQNWIDIFLSWANIDPTTVKDKTPEYVILPEELEWAEKTVGHLKPLIAVNMVASSRSRTRSDSQELIGPILEAFPQYSILWWNDEQQTWYKFNKNGLQVFPFQMSLRQSVALLSQCEVLVAMDSGLSHMAEGIASAIGLKTLCFYTTVPSWTRAKYFPNCYPVDANLPCSPCFTLHLYCPINRQRAIDKLDKREHEIMDGARSGVPVEVVAKKLQSTPSEIVREMQVIKQRIETSAAVEPDCTRQITPEIIIDKLHSVMAIGRDSNLRETA